MKISKPQQEISEELISGLLKAENKSWRSEILKKHEADYEEVMNLLAYSGLDFREEGNYKAAADLHDLTVKLAIDSENKSWQMIALSELGIDYHEVSEFDRALQCHRRALDVAREISDQGGELKTLGNIANVYRVIGNLPEAEKYFNLVLNLSRELGDLENEFLTLRHLINVCFKQDKHSAVIACYQAIFERVEALNSAGQDKDLLALMIPVFDMAINPLFLLFSGSIQNEPILINTWREMLSKQILTLAEKLLTANKVEESTDYAEFATQIAPASEEKLLAQAILLQEKGKTEEALKCCDTILAINKENSEVWERKGKILYEAERYEDAIACFEEVVRFEPHNAEIWSNIGACWLSLGEWEKMLTCDETAIIVEPTYAVAWEGKGIALMHLEQYDEAAACLEKSYQLDPQPERMILLDEANRIRKIKKSRSGFSGWARRQLQKVTKPITPSLVQNELDSANQEYARGNYEAAVRYFERAITLCEVQGVETLALPALASVGACYLAMRKPSESLPFSKRAFELAIQTGSISYQELAIGNAGLAYLALGQPEEAELAFQQALAIIEESKNESFRQKWLGALIQLYSHQGREEEANRLLDKVLEGERDFDNWDMVVLGMERAAVLKREGELDAAIELGLKCLSSVQQSTNPSNRLFVLHGLGDLYLPLTQSSLQDVPEPWFMGQVQKHQQKEQYLKAISCFEQALQVAEEMGYLDAQAQILFKIIMTRTDKAIEYIDKGLRVARQLGNKFIEFGMLHSAGSYYMDEWFPKEAEIFLHEALPLVPETPPELQAFFFIDLGAVYLCLGKLKEARKLTENALKLAEETGLEYVEIQSLGQLYNIYHNLGDRVLASEYYGAVLSRAEPIRKRSGTATSALAIGGRLNFGVHIELRILPLARNAMSSGRYDLAFQAFQEAVEFLEDARSHLPTAKQRQGLIWDKATVYWEALTAAFKAGLHQEAIELLELTKTRNLTEVVSSRDPVAGKVPSGVLADYLTTSATEKEMYQRYWEESAQHLLSDDTDPSQEAIEKHEIAWHKAQGQLLAVLERVRAYEPTFVLPYIGIPIKFPQVQNLSQITNAAIVELIVTEQSVGIMLVDPETTDVKATEVQYSEGFFRDMIVTDEQTIDQTTRNLWDALLHPITKLLKTVRTKRVIFVPSRFLNLLPLHAAWYEENGQRRYFLDLYEISYAPSASILNQCVIRHDTKQYNTGLLTVTNPLLDTPFAAEEISLIKNLFDNESLAVITSRNKVNLFLEEMPKAGYLHICSHGSDKGLHLTLPNQENIEPLAEVTTIANDAPPPSEQHFTGLLTPQEIERIDLSKVHLATLSACESGKTNPGGFLKDEYVGLPSSFLIAGVPTVVASLWKVSGISTVLLMWKFYSFLLEDLSVSQALQKAQLWLRDVSKSEVVQMLDGLRLEHYRQSLHLVEDSAEYVNIRQAFWMVESGIGWVSNQTEYPFAKPYWWAGFQVVGWPGKL